MHAATEANIQTNKQVRSSDRLITNVTFQQASGRDWYETSEPLQVVAGVVQREERRGEESMQEKPCKFWVEKSNKTYVGIFESIWVYSLLKLSRISYLG